MSLSREPSQTATFRHRQAVQIAVALVAVGAFGMLVMAANRHQMNVSRSAALVQFAPDSPSTKPAPPAITAKFELLAELTEGEFEISPAGFEQEFTTDEPLRTERSSSQALAGPTSPQLPSLAAADPPPPASSAGSSAVEDSSQIEQSKHARADDAPTESTCGDSITVAHADTIEVASVTKVESLAPKSRSQNPLAQAPLARERLAQPPLPQRPPLASSPAAQPPVAQPPVAQPQLTNENISYLRSQLSKATGRAERGAVYSARSMLIEILRDVCRMLDARAGGRQHTKALVAALRALDEADDFQYRGMQFDADLEVDSFIAGHQTRILKGQQGVSRLTARDAYYAFAREQLINACGRQRIAATACYALGRVETMIRRVSPPLQKDGPREIPLFEACLAIEPNHGVAANELGVALAASGQLRRAAMVFQKSVTITSEPQAIANLASVYERLGDSQHAAVLQQRVASLPANRRPGRSYPEVRLVSEEEFLGNKNNAIQPAGVSHSRNRLVLPQPGNQTPQQLWRIPSTPTPTVGHR